MPSSSAHKTSGSLLFSALQHAHWHASPTNMQIRHKSKGWPSTLGSDPIGIAEAISVQRKSHICHIAISTLRVGRAKLLLPSRHSLDFQVWSSWEICKHVETFQELLTDRSASKKLLSDVVCP